MPAGIVFGRRGVDLFHPSVADVDFRRSSLTTALQPGTELVTFARGVKGIENPPQRVTNDVGRNLGPVFRPIGFHHTCFRALDIDDKPRFLPELLDRVPQCLWRHGSDQPTLIAGTLDTNLVHLRQNRGLPCLRARLTLCGISRECCRTTTCIVRNQITVVALQAGKIRRHFQSRNLARRFVFDLAPFRNDVAAASSNGRGQHTQSQAGQTTIL